MAVTVIDTIKPKNNGTFPVVEAVDVKVTDSKRLDAALNDKANQSDVTALQTAVAGKASQSEVTALSNTVAGKQNALTEEQLAAANSGITSELVTQIGTNTTAIAGKASASDLATTNAAVAAKADASDVTTSVNNLQSQIDNIVSGSTEDSEVINARVDVDGTTYTTLKERLDADAEKVNDIEDVLMNSQPIGAEATTFATSKCNIAKKPNTTINRFWTCAEGDSEMNPTSIYARKLAGSNMYALEPIKLKAGVTYHTNDLRVYYCWLYDTVTKIYSRYYQVTTWPTKVSSETITPTHDSILYVSVPASNVEPMVVNDTLPANYSPYGVPIGNTVTIPNLDISSLGIDTIATAITAAAIASKFPVQPKETSFIESVYNHAHLPDTSQQSYWRSADDDDPNPSAVYKLDLDQCNMYALEPIMLKAGVTYKTNTLRVYYCFLYDTVTETYSRVYTTTTWKTKTANETFTPTHDSILYVSVPANNTQPMVVNGLVPATYSPQGEPIGKSITIPQLDVASLTNSHTVITVKKDNTGDFTSIYEAVESITDASASNIYDIHIYPGTYDVIEEVFGESEYTATEGIVLPPYVNLIGIGERDSIIVKAEFPDTVSLEVSTAFSTINVDGSNDLENITFIAYNCRYACHDDAGNDAAAQNFVRNVKNCKFWHKGCYTDDGSVWKWCKAYGMGLSSGSVSTFDCCEFRTDVEIENNCAWSCHGHSGVTKPSYINHNNCKFINTHYDLCATTNGLDDHIEEFVRYTGCEFTRSLGTGSNVQINKERYGTDGVYFIAYGVGNKNCYPGLGVYAAGASDRLHFFANDNS